MTGQELAKTILSQLGGRKFLVMTGAKNLMHDTNWLRMDLGKNASGANRLKITLNASDTYTMEFYRQTISRKTYDVKITDKGTFEMVYCDGLAQIFEEVTGMYLTL